MTTQHTGWKAAVAGLVLSLAAFATAWALPTEANVQAQIKAGQYEQAERSMAEVVGAKPDSAKARYVYAEILAHQRKFDEAARQVQRAKSLDPALKFTQPEKFRAFEALLDREQHGVSTVAGGRAGVTAADPQPAARVSTAVPAQGSSGVPGWVWGAGLAALAVLAWKALSRGFQSAATQSSVMPTSSPLGGMGNYGGYGNAAPGGYGMAPSPAGSGLRTGLAAGAGLAGGLAAGVLIDELLHRAGPVAPVGSAGSIPAAGDNALLSGVEPGFFDRQEREDAADQLASRDIDFGAGDGWDAGDGADSGADDW